MNAGTMKQFEAMRADIEAELIEVRAQVIEAAAAAADAETARLAALAARDEMAAAISPLGEAVGAPIMLRLGDQNRALHAATGRRTQTRMAAENLRGRVAELEASIAQITRLIEPVAPEPVRVETESVA
jgi:hypothetical protein